MAGGGALIQFGNDLFLDRRSPSQIFNIGNREISPFALMVRPHNLG
jgi:hypothetical protein